MQTRPLPDLAPVFAALRDGVPVRLAHGDTVAMIAGAEAADAAMINQMARRARGLICLTMTPARRHALGLRLQPRRNARPGAPDFTQSIEAATGVSTGISAGDRAATVAAAIAPGARPADIATPGHVFPVIVHPAGLPGRLALAEACHELAVAAGFSAAVYCEMLDDTGSAVPPARADLRSIDLLNAPPQRRFRPDGAGFVCGLTGARIEMAGTGPRVLLTLAPLPDTLPAGTDCAIRAVLPHSPGQLPAAIRLMRAFVNEIGAPPLSLSPGTDPVLAALWQEWSRLGPQLFDPTTDNPPYFEPAPL